MTASPTSPEGTPAAAAKPVRPTRGLLVPGVILAASVTILLGMVALVLPGRMLPDVGAGLFAPVAPPEAVARSPRYAHTRALADEMDALVARLDAFGETPADVPAAADDANGERP